MRDCFKAWDHVEEGMKLFPWFALVSLGSAIADDTAQPGGHVPVEQVLESIQAGPGPRDPQLIHVNLRR